MASRFIPGVDIIGQGFNPFATDSTSLDSGSEAALRGQLFTMGGGTNASVPWQGNPSTTQGVCPDGVSVLTSFHSGSGQVILCNSDMDLSNAVSASVGVSATYGLFRGSVEATFARQQCESSSYYYCMVEGSTNQYNLQLDEALLFGSGAQGQTKIAAALVTRIAELPMTWNASDPGCVDAYQQFFTQFGTHVISGVGMGSTGRLVVAIERSMETTTYNASLDVQADYAGMVSGSAQSKISFSNSHYLSNTKRMFVAHGGDPNAAAAVGTNPYGGSYQTWADSVTVDTVSAVSISLTGLWELNVAEPCTLAMQAAYQYLTLPSLAIPVYLYCAPNQQDFFYTSFESTSNGGEAATQELIPATWQASGPAFYSIPQGVTPPIPGSTILHRYCNGVNHFYTINPAAEILSGYQEEADKYLVVFDNGATAPNSATLNRWFCATNAHWYTDESGNPPAPYNGQAATLEGPACEVFVSAAYDPFSDSFGG